MLRRNWKLSLLASVMVFSTLTACSGGAGNGEEGNNSTNAPQSDKPAVQDGPFVKYDPPIEVHAIRGSLPDDRFKNGDTMDSNVWTKEYESALGIKLIYDWVADGNGGDDSAFNKKLNVAIASDELPDVLGVSMKQLNQLVEAGQIAELTEVYDKYVSPELKELANQDGGLALKSATFDGKLMAIPKFGGNITGADVVWIRTDWLEKLNLQAPKTMDELLAISEAFTTQDPDGNGKDDTFGLALTKDLYGGMANLTGFFNGYHAFPNIWVKDASGQIVYGNVQPEMKQALGKLQELYKNGQLDREFAVKDGGKVTESISQNKVGIQFGANWNSYYPLNDAIKQNPGMDWKPYPIVSIDDKPAQPGLGFPIYEYYVAKKSFKNPEVIVKMLNLQHERFYGETGDWEKYSVDKEGTEIFQYPLFQVFPPNKDVPDNFEAIKKAFETKDASALNPEQKANYDKIVAFQNGDAAQWAVDRQTGPVGSAFEALSSYREYAVTTSFLGASTPTMVTKKGTLDKLEKEVFTKIIMGAAFIDSFDKFVEDWKKLGGDQMTQEVNDWNAAQK
ncbi:extracellular solute-binding protein [Paenibacillus sp. LHD-117]|uniref:extracellular solute-binding protein n=1 Tax=Paenibacillus sp. LHD-117 TaxID=3071412 RepID=UPI0027E12CF8|nr:extracellular solute-binding protein [Paenibacillus sp. LHD-117]MDQ6417951.1 extracellular solute-binding protein [Paenibacillus sp. LHD-117]